MEKMLWPIDLVNLWLNLPERLGVSSATLCVGKLRGLRVDIIGMSEARKSDSGEMSVGGIPTTTQVSKQLLWASRSDYTFLSLEGDGSIKQVTSKHSLSFISVTEV